MADINANLNAEDWSLGFRVRAQGVGSRDDYRVFRVSGEGSEFRVQSLS